ncbi:conserved hypothetical protein [Theileria equi strain WA]|uniref:Uncharacterized protein n=1 Tax=Theileria equi strain WA TaxID=1537102 RepID=L1LFD8_THEEQ|nr:conserved hypothetical protein [Theileria equi strain WA]EKX74071.1 conserved hypothetical protein [Theileria equi strain WA]|eukprot:XP_004833523.1 conserved hypothetical protein [Theileria equi strain WA]
MELKEVFDSYSQKKNVLESRMYIKMFRDAKMLNSKLTTTSLDLVFIKYKPKSLNGLDYTQFCQSLEDIAFILDITKNEIINKLKELNGPVFTGTTAIPTRFHDYKASYTGVHIHGGPSVVDSNGLNRL